MTNHNTACCEIAPVFNCQHCGRSSESVQTSSARLTCSFCGKEGSSAPPKKRRTIDGHWTNIARVTNLAEAGFLADDLGASDIDARVYQSDEFNALGGNWATTFLIQVPADRAHDAAARIRRHLLDDENQLDQFGSRMPVASDLPFDPATWRPLALVVLAGMASFVLGQRFAALEMHRRPPQRDSLSAVIDKIGRPLMTEPIPGKPRYRLSYDWRREAWQLDADRDGDGRYDQRRQFQATGVGW